MKKIVTALALCGVMASGQALSGLELMTSCRPFIKTMNGHRINDADFVDAGQCIGYTQAAIDINLQIAESIHTVCVPNNVTYFQYILVLRKYLNNHPEMLNIDATDLYMEALETYYPCKTQEKK